MQTNAAAFEGWAVALLSYAGAQSVRIDWDMDEAADRPSRHYARFMYRIERFATLLGDRVILADRDRAALARKALLARGPVLNVALGADTSHRDSPSGSEAAAEKWFKRPGHPARVALMNDFGLDALCRQFPVGVFERQANSGREIFTGGKSAIDLIGVGKDKAIWIFELKVGSNIAVGALSELIFYSTLLLDTHGEAFGFSGQAGSRAEVNESHVHEASRIHACILADRTHPLLGEQAFSLLNEAAALRGWPIDFQYVPLEKYRGLAEAITSRTAVAE